MKKFYKYRSAIFLILIVLSPLFFSFNDVFAKSLSVLVVDTDGDGTINGPELYKGIKSIVGEALTPDQISAIIKSLDSDGDNRIDVMELRNALS